MYYNIMLVARAFNIEFVIIIWFSVKGAHLSTTKTMSFLPYERPFSRDTVIITGIWKMTVGHYMHMKMPYFRDTIPFKTKEPVIIYYSNNNIIHT